MRRRAASTTICTTRPCSACESVAASPVEPQGATPSTPAATWSSTSSRSAGSSISPSRKGVTSAVKTPSNTAQSPSMPDLPREDLRRGSGHRDVRAVVRPGDLELAAAQLDRDRALDEAAQHGYHGDRAGTAPAGERLAGAALPGALPDPAAADGAREFDVHPVREGRVVLDARAQRLDRRAIGIVDEDHGVGVAHRHGRHTHALADDVEGHVEHGPAPVAERGRNLLGLEDRPTHVDRARDPARRPAASRCRRASRRGSRPRAYGRARAGRGSRRGSRWRTSRPASRRR